MPALKIEIGGGSLLFCVRLSGGEEAATTSTDFASASVEPSLPTRVMEISDFPAAPAGSVIFRLDSAAMGTAQEPGAIECPSDNAMVGGKPRILMKLPFAMESGGPTRMASGA